MKQLLDLLKDPALLFKHLRDPVLVFLFASIVVLVGGIVAYQCVISQQQTSQDASADEASADQASGQERNLGWPVILGAITALVVIVLVGCWIRYYWEEKSRVGPLEQRVKQLKAENEGMQTKLDSPPIKVITPYDYGQLLLEWNRCGEGHVLLWNIELQSFNSDAAINRTWGKISKLTNVKSIVLLLPPQKVRRWERVVLRQEKKFFADEANRKFLVCEFTPSDTDSASAVAFALYRFGHNPGSGRLHDTALAFVLSNPFSQLREPRVPEDDSWWDYHHILRFHNDQEIVTNMDQTWRRFYDEAKTRDVQRILEDTRRLEPVQPSVLFDRLNVAEHRKAELLEHFTDRRMVKPTPALITAGKESTRPFSLKYDNGEVVQGRCVGVHDNPRQAVVWVGGFTERYATRLPRLFERVLKKEDVVQFYYKVSPPIEYITLTRYMQDMAEVLRYVRQQRVAVPDQVVLVARSINGLLAALVAAEDEFLDVLAGVILVAPVFDVIEMIDNYRATRQSSKAHVRLENCWRASPGYSADRWEDPEYAWLEFFEHHVSLTLFADIIRHHPDKFSIEGFKHAIGKISQSRPVFVLSNADDPIVSSQRARRILNDAKGTLIREENYQFLEIKSSHYTVVQRDKYPFAPREEAGKTRDALRTILGGMGVPTLTESPARQ